MSPLPPHIESCLNVLRRTPPEDAGENVSALSSLLLPDEDASERLCQLVDPFPLRIARDPTAASPGTKKRGRPYLLSDHNRDGDSHRSPWSGEYFPPLPPDDDDEEGCGFRPDARLRALEVRFNEVFEAYRELYYGAEGSVCSVYLWDDDGDGRNYARDGSFAGAILIRKDVRDGSESLRGGCWCSVHVVDASPLGDGRCKYSLTATVQLTMDAGPSSSAPGRTAVSGSFVRRSERVASVDGSADGPRDTDHVANVGSLVEETEIEMRGRMDGLDVVQTRTAIDSLRLVEAGDMMTGGGQRGSEGAEALGRRKVAMMMTEAVTKRLAGRGVAGGSGPTLPGGGRRTV